MLHCVVHEFMVCYHYYSAHAQMNVCTHRRLRSLYDLCICIIYNYDVRRAPPPVLSAIISKSCKKTIKVPPPSFCALSPLAWLDIRRSESCRPKQILGYLVGVARASAKLQFAVGVVRSSLSLQDKKPYVCRVISKLFPSVTIDSKKNLSMSVKAFVVAALLLSSTALLASGDDDCDDGSKNPSKLSFKKYNNNRQYSCTSSTCMCRI